MNLNPFASPQPSKGWKAASAKEQETTWGDWGDCDLMKMITDFCECLKSEEEKKRDAEEAEKNKLKGKKMPFSSPPTEDKTPSTVVVSSNNFVPSKV